MARRLGLKPRTLRWWSWKLRDGRSMEAAEFQPIIVADSSAGVAAPTRRTGACEPAVAAAWPEKIKTFRGFHDGVDNGAGDVQSKRGARVFSWGCREQQAPRRPAASTGAEAMPECGFADASGPCEHVG